MSGITRCILRYGVIGGLALGGITLLVGPERVAAGLAQVRTKAQNAVDGCMDDPVALRRQLAQLADQYPDRIEEVSGEIAAVDTQIGQFERDVKVARKVVSLTTEDLQNLKDLVARAESRIVTPASLKSGRPNAVFIRYEGVRFTVDEAMTEGQRINHIRTTTQDRLAHDEFQLKFLGEQKGRLDEILAKLQEEYGTYQAQLWQLDRQIDAIERNDRLIELTEEQQATLQSYERFGKVANLKQLESKLAELRARQEAQLRTLEKFSVVTDYERAAIFELETLDTTDPFVEIYEIELEETDMTVDEDDSMAFNTPIIIEQN
ncbi:MAG: hypothetical protein GY715_18290 [Planctomycetes bacterium]|nr:hypothetical protein [Planctomycetota bacterium]